MSFVKLIKLCVVLSFCEWTICAMVGSTNSPLDTKKYMRGYNYFPQVNAFYKFHLKQKTWFDAKAYCDAEGAALAVIRTEQEADLVQKFLNSSPESRRNVWIGVQDLISEGEFETIDAAPINSVYNGWDNGEPNDAGGNEDCVAFQPNGKLNDGNCLNKDSFLCKKDADTVKENVNCDNYDIEYKISQTDQCIKFHTIPKTWDEAYAICNAEEAHLAIINSAEEAKLYASELEKYPASSLKGNFNKDIVHIGFHDKFVENEHVTVNGKPLSNSGYEEWFAGQPDNFNEEDCGSMTRNGQLNDIGCNVRAMFICEKNLDNVLNVAVFNRISFA